MAQLTPARLGRYEILEELGRGAMGVVYLAHDPLIGRQVALKVLRIPATSGEEELEQFRLRFIREAQSAGILSHPNIVTVHDVVEEAESGATFIAMEYIRGTDVKELLKGKRPQDLGLIRDLVSQVADALDYAHSKGVVHRDVKPANILITEEGEVKITDFGIARLETSNITHDTQLLGTPNYMAPEQIQGGPVDHRTDIFSFGVLLYELLTGKKPFQGESLTEVTHRIVYEEFTPLNMHEADLPPDIEGVLHRALAKKPDERYSSAKELAADFCRIVDSRETEEALNETQEVVIPPPTPSEPGGRERSRRPGTGSQGARLKGFLRRLAGKRGRGEAPAQGLSAGRLLRIVALPALMLLAGWILLAWIGISGTEPQEHDAEHQLRVRTHALVREAHRLWSAGDSLAAAEEFRKAERLAPGRSALHAWREIAEHQAELEARMTERERRLAQTLAAGQSALTARRYRTALEAADQALRLAGDNEEAAAEALAIRSAAESGLDRIRRRSLEARRSQAERAGSAAEGADGGSAAVAPRESARAGDPQLEVEFITEQPRGNLTVFVGERRLLNENFRFVDKKGFLGLGGSEAYDGRIYLPPTRVPSGKSRLRIHVTPRGQAAEVKILEADFQPGSNLKLSIFFSRAGELTARLE